MCVLHESGVLRVFNLEMDRPRIRFYEAKLKRPRKETDVEERRKREREKRRGEEKKGRKGRRERKR